MNVIDFNSDNEFMLSAYFNFLILPLDKTGICDIM